MTEGVSEKLYAEKFRADSSFSIRRVLYVLSQNFPRGEGKCAHLIASRQFLPRGIEMPLRTLWVLVQLSKLLFVFHWPFSRGGTHRVFGKPCFPLLKGAVLTKTAKMTNLHSTD